jgi:hypothetical protein
MRTQALEPVAHILSRITDLTGGLSTVDPFLKLARFIMKENIFHLN